MYIIITIVAISNAVVVWFEFLFRHNLIEMYVVKLINLLMEKTPE